MAAYAECESRWMPGCTGACPLRGRHSRVQALQPHGRVLQPHLPLEMPSRFAAAFSYRPRALRNSPDNGVETWG